MASAALARLQASQLARRDALNLTASAPWLSDLLSNSRSGDAADQQVACVCSFARRAAQLGQRSQFSSCPGSPTDDGADDNVVRWLREHRHCTPETQDHLGRSLAAVPTSNEDGDGCDGCSTVPPVWRCRRVRGVSSWIQHTLARSSVFDRTLRYTYIRSYRY